MEAAFRYRMATRLARRLREAGRPLPLPALGEALGLRGPVERVVRPLLDGRFLLEEGVGLWEWRYPFPLEGEAVVVLAESSMSARQQESSPRRIASR